MVRRATKLSLVLLLGHVVVAPLPAQADTLVSGAITTNTTWTAANGPYVVTGTVVVRTGATLTIEPGVEVRFSAPTYRLDVSDTARLIAVGTSALPIIFTSTQAAAGSPAAGQWSSVRFTDSSQGTLDYVSMRYGGYGTAYYSSGLVQVAEDATVSIDHSTFEDSDTSGILVRSENEVLISHTLIRDNGNGLSVVGGTYGVVTVTHSNITSNHGQGVFLSWSNTPPQRSVFTLSDITENGGNGFYMNVASAVPYSAYPSGTYNNILGNDGKNIFPVFGRSDTFELWDWNYYGEYVDGPLSCPLASQTWQWHIFYWTEPTYPQEGPIRSTTYEYEGVKCAADYIPVLYFKEEPIPNDAP